MPLPDIIVFSFYVFGMIGIALLFARKNTSASAMFGANSQAPWWVSGLSAFMTMFSAGSFVVWGGLAYREGVVAISILMALGVSGLIVAAWVAPRWKQLNVGSPSEFIRRRFGPGVLQYFTWTLLIARIISCGVALYALAIVLVPIVFGLSGDSAQYVQWTIIVLGLVVVFYTMLGGLWAVLVTDVLQFIVLSISVVFTLGIAISSAGGLPNVVASLPQEFLQPVNNEFTVAVLGGWVATHVFVLGAEWAFVQRHLAVPSAADAKKAMYLFGVLYLISPVIWMGPAIIYRTMNADANPEQAYILVSSETLPIGLLGLMAAAMFSATASMLSSQINVFAGMLTKDVFARHFSWVATGREVLTGRVLSVLLGCLIIVLALLVPLFGGAEQVVFALVSLLFSPLFAPALWAVFSKNIRASAVWTTAAFAGSAGIIVRFWIGSDSFKSGSDLLNELADWITANPRVTDALIGVVMPLLVLGVFEVFARFRAQRQMELPNEDKDLAGQEQTADIPKPDAFLPLAVVAGGLAICSVVMFLLVFVNTENRLGLLSGGAVLGIFSIVMIPLLRNRNEY